MFKLFNSSVASKSAEMAEDLCSSEIRELTDDELKMVSGGDLNAEAAWL